MLQVLEGIVFLHDNNIVHRDIKPKNILVKNQDIKITDLGISKIIEQDTKNDSNTLAFTPRYASLESTNGNATF